MRIFLTPEQFANGMARIDGSDHLHLTRVMRAKIGERVLLLDGQGGAWTAEIAAIEKTETRARILEAVTMPPEPSVFLTVAQALGKGDKFEQVIQHGTEAGASAFIPIQAERSIVEIPAAKRTERLARWRQIAKSAAEQSGRSKIPFVSEPMTLRQAIEQAEDIPILLLHTDSRADNLKAVWERWSGVPKRLLLAVGPEGGWSPAEVSAASHLPVTLGPRVLRTETAALVAISQILYAAG